MCISTKQIKQTNETLRLPALFIPYALFTDMYQNFMPIVRDTCDLVRYELGSFSSCKKNPEFRSKLKTTVEFTDVGISIPLIKKSITSVTSHDGGCLREQLAAHDKQTDYYR